MLVRVVCQPKHDSATPICINVPIEAVRWCSCCRGTTANAVAVRVAVTPHIACWGIRHAENKGLSVRVRAESAAVDGAVTLNEKQPTHCGEFTFPSRSDHEEIAHAAAKYQSAPSSGRDVCHP